MHIGWTMLFTYTIWIWMPKILSYIKPPPTHINLRYTPGRHDDKKDSTLLYHLIPVILQMYVKNLFLINVYTDYLRLRPAIQCLPTLCATVCFSLPTWTFLSAYINSHIHKLKFFSLTNATWPEDGSCLVEFKDWIHFIWYSMYIFIRFILILSICDCHVIICFVFSVL